MGFLATKIKVLFLGFTTRISQSKKKPYFSQKDKLRSKNKTDVAAFTCQYIYLFARVSSKYSKYTSQQGYIV